MPAGRFFQKGDHPTEPGVEYTKAEARKRAGLNGMVVLGSKSKSQE